MAIDPIVKKKTGADVNIIAFCNASWPLCYTQHVVQPLDDSDKLIAIDDVDVTAVETGPTGSVPIVWAARPAT